MNSAINFAIYKSNFEACYDHLLELNLLPCFIVMEIMGRMTIVLCMNKENCEKAFDYKEKRNLTFLKKLNLLLMINLCLLFIFLRKSGTNDICSYLYLTGSVAGVSHAILYHLSVNLSNIIERALRTYLKNRELRVLRIQGFQIVNKHWNYHSETVDDFVTEVELLVTNIVLEFFKVKRILFSVIILSIALQEYGMQVPMSFYTMKCLFEMLYCVITFVNSVIDAWDSWSCYKLLSEKELLHYSLGDHCTSCHQGDNNQSKEDKSATETKGDHQVDDSEVCNPREADLCAICFLPFNIETVKLKCCMHKFHEGCLLCLLRIAKADKAAKCPICRVKIRSRIEDDMGFLVPHM